MNGRDENGRFVKGNQVAKGTKAGPGRPKKAREQRYYEIMCQRVTFADWRKIIDVAIARAKSGDREARKWLADYLMGPPVKRTELTGADGGPIETKDVSDVTDEERIARLVALLDAARARRDRQPDPDA